MTESQRDTVRPVPPEVYKTIVEAFYPRLVTQGEMVRARAQSAHGIVSAIVGVLVVTVITGKVEFAGPVARVSGLVALAMWLIAATLYVKAVASPVKDPGEAQSPGDLVDKVLTAVTAERNEVDSALRKANFLAVVAMTTTIVAFAALWFLPGEADRSDGTLRLSAAGLAAIQTICPGASRNLVGQVLRSSIGADFTTIDLDAKTCGSKTAQIQVPKVQVEAVILYGTAASPPH